MAVESHLAVGQTLGNIAVGIVAVADVSAATKAGNVLQGFPMVNGITVCLLDLETLFLGKGGKTSLRYSFQQVTVRGFP
jgi:hypothetical protein